MNAPFEETTEAPGAGLPVRCEGCDRELPAAGPDGEPSLILEKTTMVWQKPWRSPPIHITLGAWLCERCRTTTAAQ